MPPRRSDDHRHSGDDDRPGHLAIEAEKVEPRTDRCLRRGNPFEEMPAGNEQPGQGPYDGVGHQPRLMRKEADHERRLGESEAEIGAKRAEVAAHGDSRPPRDDGSDDGDQGRQYNRREYEESPNRRRLERQGPSRQQGEDCSRSRQRTSQIVEHLPAADRRDGATLPILAGDGAATQYPG